MKNSEVKSNIEIGGVILTEKAIRRLHIFQQHNNEDLEDSSRVMADIICLIIQHRDDFGENEIDKVDTLLSDLSSIRDHFKDLEKP